ncbi:MULTISPECIES: hypothetical protein [unclassified Nostoc]|nr:MULTISPECIES: hypothetical protein [unclassified Nostoc]MDZ8123752.1 hypothetical protein [Nostoc sp. CmiVER01]MDZ8221542.1 hypothetical protein [Nostoc sp. ChiVER01]
MVLLVTIFILTGTPETDSIFGDLGDDTLDGLGGDDKFSSIM